MKKYNNFLFFYAIFSNVTQVMMKIRKKMSTILIARRDRAVILSELRAEFVRFATHNPL